MQAKYNELIEDHAHIERCAQLLAEEVAKPDAQPDRLVRQMHDLALVVSDHIAVEAGLVDLCDGKLLPAPWRKAWVDGRGQFEALRCDWLDFLNDWTAEAIACDVAGFRLAALDILDRLSERVRLETTGIYAVALQTGAIAFK